MSDNDSNTKVICIYAGIDLHPLVKVLLDRSKFDVTLVFNTLCDFRIPGESKKLISLELVRLLNATLKQHMGEKEGQSPLAKLLLGAETQVKISDAEIALLNFLSESYEKTNDFVKAIQAVISDKNKAQPMFPVCDSLIDLKVTKGTRGAPLRYYQLTSALPIDLTREKEKEGGKRGKRKAEKDKGKEKEEEPPSDSLEPTIVNLTPLRKVKLSDEAREAIDSANAILLVASDLVSLSVMLKTEELRRVLTSKMETIVCISPIGKNLKPTGTEKEILMAMGVEPTLNGLAELVDGVIDRIVIDKDDLDNSELFISRGISVLVEDLSPEHQLSLSFLELILQAADVELEDIAKIDLTETPATAEQIEEEEKDESAAPVSGGSSAEQGVQQVEPAASAPETVSQQKTASTPEKEQKLQSEQEEAERENAALPTETEQIEESTHIETTRQIKEISSQVQEVEAIQPEKSQQEPRSAEQTTPPDQQKTQREKKRRQKTKQQGVTPQAVQGRETTSGQKTKEGLQQQAVSTTEEKPVVPSTATTVEEGRVSPQEEQELHEAANSKQVAVPPEEAQVTAKETQMLAAQAETSTEAAASTIAATQVTTTGSETEQIEQTAEAPVVTAGGKQPTVSSLPQAEQVVKEQVPAEPVEQEQKPTEEVPAEDQEIKHVVSREEIEKEVKRVEEASTSEREKIIHQLKQTIKNDDSLAHYTASLLVEQITRSTTTITLRHYAQVLGAVSDVSPLIFRAVTKARILKDLESPDFETRGHLATAMRLLVSQYPKFVSNVISSLIQVQFDKQTPQHIKERIRFTVLRIAMEKERILKETVGEYLKRYKDNSSNKNELRHTLMAFEAGIVGLCLIEDFSMEMAREIMTDLRRNISLGSWGTLIDEILTNWEKGNIDKIISLAGALSISAVKKAKRLSLAEKLKKVGSISLETFAQSVGMDPKDVESMVSDMILNDELQARLEVIDGRLHIVQRSSES